MFDPRDQDRPWHLYVRDMIEFAERVVSYTDGLDYDAFVADGLTYDATLRNIELVGEAATHIPEEIRTEHTEIPWRNVVGTRNQLAHGYLGIDNDVIWDIIEHDVPDLLRKLHKLLEDTNKLE